jgi:hypothetical protein
MGSDARILPSRCQSGKPGRDELANPIREAARRASEVRRKGM